MYTFGERFKQLRLKKGYTQQEMTDQLTELCGYAVSRSTLGMWESGKRVPQRETLEVIANIFGVSIDWLLGRDMTPIEAALRLAAALTNDEKETKTEAPAPREYPEITLIARAGQKMSPEQRELMLKWARLTFPEAFEDTQ